MIKMNAFAIAGLVAALVTIASVLIGVLWRLARIDFRVEEMWQAFKAQPPEVATRGRRRYDRPLVPFSEK